MNRPTEANRGVGTNREDGYFTAGVDHVAAALEALGGADAVSLALLGDNTRRRLLAAARRGAWRPARAVVGGGDTVVRQEMEVRVEFAAHGPFHELARRFQALVGDAAARLGGGLFATPLRLDDLVLQRYRAGALGITPHRDGLRYINLAALFTLSGEARFCLCDDRGGGGAREVDATPGTVILLRAPGFRGRAGRPFHFVSDIRARRYSFGLRQLAPRDEPDSGPAKAAQDSRSVLNS